MEAREFQLKSVKCKVCKDPLKVLKVKRPIFCSENCRFEYQNKKGPKDTGKNCSPHHWKNRNFREGSRVHNNHKSDTSTSREALGDLLGLPSDSFDISEN